MRAYFLCLICLGLGMLVSCDRGSKSPITSYEKLAEGETIIHSFKVGDASVKIQAPAELKSDANWIGYDGSCYFSLWIEKASRNRIEIMIDVPDGTVEILEYSGAYKGSSLDRVEDLWILKKGSSAAE